MIRSSGKRISQFLEDATPADDADFTFIQEGANWKIPYSDLLAAVFARGFLPVTGSDDVVTYVPLTSI